jgi:hypothetical protein
MGPCAKLQSIPASRVPGLSTRGGGVGTNLADEYYLNSGFFRSSWDIDFATWTDCWRSARR